MFYVIAEASKVPRSCPMLSYVTTRAWARNVLKFRLRWSIGYSVWISRDESGIELFVFGNPIKKLSSYFFIQTINVWTNLN